MFEGVVEDGALAGGGFHEEGDVFGGFFEDLDGLFGDDFEAFLFALFHVGAHVADDVGDAELAAAVEFAGEGFDGLFLGFGVGGAEVDEVAVVADDVGVSDAGIGESFIEFLDLVFGDVFGVPHLGGGGEDLDGGATDFFAVLDGFVEASGGGHVGSDEGGGHGVQGTWGFFWGVVKWS